VNASQITLTILWGYPHITVREDQTARAEPCIFIGSSLKDLRRFPAKVKNRFGFALNAVQEGGEPMAAKALRGFGGRTVLELIEDFDSDTYRAVYTVKFAGVVYVLHAFQKKAKKGIATPRQDIELIKSRLRDAELHYLARVETGERK
jgi:phage-related protein